MKKFKNRKTLLSFLIIFLFGLIFGIVFNFIINVSDHLTIENMLDEYFKLIENTRPNIYSVLNSFKYNYIYITIIWVVGLLPALYILNYFMIFYKGFLLGFLISSIIIIYKFKGIFLSLIALFPHEYLNVLIIITLSIISIKFSKKIYNRIKEGKTLNFNNYYKDYLKIYAIFIAISLINSLFEVFLNSLFIKLVL